MGQSSTCVTELRQGSRVIMVGPSINNVFIIKLHIFEKSVRFTQHVLLTYC